jgi:broad specificity phosphatase PhoE
MEVSEMNGQKLIATAQEMVAEGKGLLAMDESTPTCNQRFEKLGIPQTEETRRSYRELIVTTPGLDEFISGFILYDETIRQSGKEGTTFVKLITDAGIIPGIKVGIDIARRSSLVIEEIEKTCTTGNVLVVSHKATTRIMLCSLLGIDVGRFRDRLSMSVGSISIIEMATHGPLLHRMGYRSYLRDHLRKREDT